MSDGFSSGWLDLREPYDAAARSRILLERLSAWCLGRQPLRVVDLGAGTGSNLRGTAPTLGTAQDWTLAELDQDLIAAGRARLAEASVAWRYHRVDLADDLENLVGESVDLITASALIDLVDEPWLRRLTAWRDAADAALYVVLSYDGRVEWQPSDIDDADMIGLVNRHQHFDKGFGAALGPHGAPLLHTLLSSAKGELLIEPSVWSLMESDREIQIALLDGYTAAAALVEPERRRAILAWSDRRRLIIADGRSRLRVGHQDLLFLPER